MTPVPRDEPSIFSGLHQVTRHKIADKISKVKTVCDRVETVKKAVVCKKKWNLGFFPIFTKYLLFFLKQQEFFRWKFPQIVTQASGYEIEHLELLVYHYDVKTIILLKNRWLCNGLSFAPIYLKFKRKEVLLGRKTAL